ncbi:MAG: substrate-binding domain-containing protein [Acidimicrobiales bacterium]|nr:substrate-binding domain-containing protein [Acidimicrobiales bacterium]
MRIAQSAMRPRRLTRAPGWCRGALALGVLAALSTFVVSAPAGAERPTDRPNAAGGAPLSGGGSSFAAPAINTWDNATAGSPYNLSVQYAVSNSGTGRYEFTNQTIDFGVSDIGYVGHTDTTPPSFPFNFIPITAGGIAFMYHVPGLSKQLQLSSLTVCELLTGGIKNWNDPKIAADNPGVTLPSVPVVPVTESDSAGTNYVLEEWCIAEQPAAWAAFVAAQEAQSGGPTDGVTLSPTSPNSEWPGIQGGLDDQTTTAVTKDVASDSGAIGAVQVKYAQDVGFDGSDPTQNVALVKNASGDYTPPTPVDVASALAYATQLPNGTHQLNFGGAGAHVYNPSTYSYLLTPTTGWSSSKGNTMSQYVDYVLTLGQKSAPGFGYASLGLSLEQYGINEVQKYVPGAVAPTAAESQAYSCGDLTPSEVAAGQTTPTCGVVLATAAGGANAGTASGSAGSSTTSATAAAAGAAAGHGVSSTGSSSGGSGGAGGGAGGGANPSVALTGTSSMAGTGINPVPLTAIGLGLLLIGVIGRRRALKRRLGDAP